MNCRCRGSLLSWDGAARRRAWDPPGLGEKPKEVVGGGVRQGFRRDFLDLSNPGRRQGGKGRFVALPTLGFRGQIGGIGFDQDTLQGNPLGHFPQGFGLLERDDPGKRNVESQFVLRDFMIPLEESPVIHQKDLSFKHVLETIEKGKLGFALVVKENNEYVGLVSNADVRKTLLHSINDLSNLDVSTMINTASVGIQETATVNDMLQLIKKYAFPITYLPVLNEGLNAVGIVTFVNLIRGEI